MRELSVTVARGCPLGCAFCIIHNYQGRKERRQSVESVLACINQARASYPFDYVSMFAPTFTLQRDWVLDFCAVLERHPQHYRWKACTTLQDLDEELIRRMGSAGCLRLSVGLETLDPGAIGFLPSLASCLSEMDGVTVELHDHHFYCRSVRGALELARTLPSQDLVGISLLHHNMEPGL